LEQFVETWALLESRAFLIGGLHFVIAAAVTAHALMTKRDVPAAIGWIGMAWLTPILGALLYVGFGINRVKRRARRLKGSVRSVHRVVASQISSEDPLERLKAAIGKITHQDMMVGKVVAILDCGDQAYPQMLAAIESAKFHIRLSSYIFRADDVGLQFIAALARAHRRGVRIRVLIDGFGGGFLCSSAYHHLRRQGVPVSRFLHSALPWKMPFLDLRLHKKSLVVDGESAFVGGLNIGAENVFAKHPKPSGQQRGPPKGSRGLWLGRQHHHCGGIALRSGEERFAQASIPRRNLASNARRASFRCAGGRRIRKRPGRIGDCRKADWAKRSPDRCARP
jgi:cardiolipin synthase